MIYLMLFQAIYLTYNRYVANKLNSYPFPITSTLAECYNSFIILCEKKTGNPFFSVTNYPILILICF